MDLNIVFIGDSVTQGVIITEPEKNAPPAQMLTFLRENRKMGVIRYANCGVSGATTVDFLPNGGSLFRPVTKAADQLCTKGGLLLFSISLGPNDSAIKGPNGAPVSAEQYYQNMRLIIDRLLALYPKAKVVVQCPTWYSPNAHNGAIYLEVGLERLKSYLPQLRRLEEFYVNRQEVRVAVGNCEAFDFFCVHYQTHLVPERGYSGVFYLHPNLKGAAELGAFWGKTIMSVLTE